MRAIALVSIGLSTIAFAQMGETVDTARKAIRIQPVVLRAALPTFCAVEGLHMVFLPDDVANRSTFGVTGSPTQAEALEQLLRGTDLTYRFLEPRTVMILPVSLARAAPVEPSSASESGDKTGDGTGGPAGPGTRVAQVTITATRPSDAQQLEYFRLLAAMSRSDYKRQVKTLSFEDAGSISFPGGEGPQHRLPLGEHIQSAGIDGLVLWRVMSLTWARERSQLQVHNSNSFPVFVEVDFEKTVLGRGAYAALAPGETAVWTWPPRYCGSGSHATAYWSGSSAATQWSSDSLADWGCDDYVVEPGTAHVRVLTEWGPG